MILDQSNKVDNLKCIDWYQAKKVDTLTQEKKQNTTFSFVHIPFCSTLDQQWADEGILCTQ